MRETDESDRLPVATVFCGSFLLFMVQPLLGRTLLPIFGGGAAVWCVCLATFQTLLLVGYAYAHGIEVLRGRLHRAHVVFVAGATLWAWAVALFRTRLTAFLGADGGNAAWVLVGVILLAGLPYVALAAGSTLVQAWLARTSRASGGVYRLYAVSNVGSLSGLLSYPLLLEPFVPLTAQWLGLAVGLTGYAVLIGALAWRCPAAVRPAASSSCAVSGDMPLPSAALWFLLPGFTAFLLNATTAHLLVDVTPMPLVWVVLLAAFLLSYVLGFSSVGERYRLGWSLASGGALAAAAFACGKWGTGSFFPNLGASVAVLVCVGTLLHGWLYAVRPSAAFLTRYYLSVAAGGAAGGLLAALVAPLVFTRITEYPLALFLCAVLAAWRAPRPAALAGNRRAGVFSLAAGAAWLALAHVTAHSSSSQTLYRSRNFYGCLAVTQTFEQIAGLGVLPVHYLWCGQTTHGVQICSSAREVRDRAVSYYGPTAGGLALSSHPKYRSGEPMKVGVVGLGAGAMARYGRAGDLYRFYEINPDVVKIATDPQLFTFLPDASMPIDLVPGDARRMLEKERGANDPRYDVLIVDAYNGDAVPYHLATREAFRLYFDRLEENGILAVHVSNWHIDLLPLCKAMSSALDVCAYGVVSCPTDGLTAGAVWVFMTRHPIAYHYVGKDRVMEIDWQKVRTIAAPTDERGSLISLIRY